MAEWAIQVKLSVSQWVVVLSCIVVVAVVVTMLLTKLVQQRPEVELSREFLVQHSDIFVGLGRVKSITYRRQAASRVSFKREKIEGFYSFTIRGDANEASVRVFWDNSRSGDDFRVIRVEQLNKGKTPIPLWPEGERARH